MIDKSAIDAISKSAAIEAAAEAILATTTMEGGEARLIALPDNFNLHDLERYMPCRRRARGAMSTSDVGDFAAYINRHAENGCTIFVQPDRMKATAVLNLGIPDNPGHADNLAELTPRQTAAFSALKAIANGSAKGQKDVAEWMEDWSDLLSCSKDGAAVETKHAVAAIRKLAIEATKKVESAEQSLSSQRSAFESVAATSTDPLPTHIATRFSPFTGLSERTFVLRLGVLTTEKPSITLRIIKIEEHEEEMGRELAELIGAEIDGINPVLLGAYKAS